MRNKFHVEWKSKDGKQQHAWIVDEKENIEAKLCEPTKHHRWISKYYKVEFTQGKLCKACLRKLEPFKAQFPQIKVEA